MSQQSWALATGGDPKVQIFSLYTKGHFTDF